MTNIEGFCFTNIDKKILDLLIKLKIQVLDSLDGVSWYTISNYCLYRTSPELYPHVSYEQIIDILKCRIEDNVWWQNLKVGDEIEIAPRYYDAEDYPFSYANAMAEDYSGCTAIIDRIKKTFGTTGYKCSNGDENFYYLDIDGHQFMWHSSMFVAKDLTPVKKIELISLPINKLLIN